MRLTFSGGKIRGNSNRQRTYVARAAILSLFFGSTYPPSAAGELSRNLKSPLSALTKSGSALSACVPVMA
ncbi:MAG TPA: hypothetical protein VK658_07350 [Chryseolinea sp.]|nr:hypothetical protein [Chryseolinea sp.]